MHIIHEEIGIPKVTPKKVTDRFYVFTMEPLPNGYGTTVGNALRRVLLSSLPGAAATGLKIEGIKHEYSTLKGVKDSVLDIILNLKQVRFKKDSKDSSWVTLEANKEGAVTAANIKCPTGVEVLNPETYLTTLDKGGKLSMSIRVDKGVGYVSVPELRKVEEDAEVILIDASFCPVLRVSYEVEAARVGQRTDLDKLQLEIETDGSITPQDALVFSANMLSSYFTLFNKEGIIVEESFVTNVDDVIEKEKAREQEEKEKESYTPIEILNLSPRTLNALINGGIGSIEQLTKCTESKLANLRGFGKKAMTEIRSALKERNLKLLGDE